MKRNLFIILVVLVLIGFGVRIWYLSSERKAVPIVPITTDEDKIPSAEVTGVVREINMTAFQFGFDPSTITVNKGDKVIIYLVNKDLPHGLNLDGFDVHISPAPKGEVRTVEFIADKVGTFFYFCNNPYCGEGHNRQIGKFIVK